MEIDVREESSGKPDVIRFSDELRLDYLDPASCAIVVDEDGRETEIMMSEIPNLIKALKKYQELYGESN